MKKIVSILLCAAVYAGPALAQSPQGKLDVPVMAGGEPNLDACGTSGVIVGLDPRGDGFLSVRSGPGGSKFREIARVYNGMRVYICDQKGPWLAVVYSSNKNASCNVTTPWAKRKAYTGPCNYGWIHSKYVGGLAG